MFRRSTSKYCALPIVSGSAPERMMKGIRAQEAARANKRASDAFDGGDVVAAEKEWQSAVKTLKSTGLGEDVCILEPMNNLACAVGELGRGKEKLALLNEHSALTKKLYGEKHPQYVVSSYNHAAALGDVGRPFEMKSEMERVLEAQRMSIPAGRRDHHPKVARVLLGLADAQGKCEMYEERWKTLKQAMPIVISHVTNHHPQVAAVYLALCDASLDLWYMRRRFGSITLPNERDQDFTTVEDLVRRDSSEATSNDQKSLDELKKDKTDRVISLLSPPRTAEEAAKQALYFARKAFEIESQVIPQTQSHLLTHSRLALSRSRSCLSPALTFFEIAPFISDMRNDVIKHTNETGKLLTPIMAYAANDAARRVYVDERFEGTSKYFRNEEQLRDLVETAQAMSETAFQISIRHFDATGHIETPRRLTEQAVTYFACTYRVKEVVPNFIDTLSSMSSGTAENDPVEKKLERWCKEALRRFDALGSEEDFLYRKSAKKILDLLNSSSSSSKSILEDETKQDVVDDIVRGTLKF